MHTLICHPKAALCVLSHILLHFVSLLLTGLVYHGYSVQVISNVINIKLCLDTWDHHIKQTVVQTASIILLQLKGINTVSLMQILKIQANTNFYVLVFRNLLLQLLLHKVKNYFLMNSCTASNVWSSLKFVPVADLSSSTDKKTLQNS